MSLECIVGSPVNPGYPLLTFSPERRFNLLYMYICSLAVEISDNIPHNIVKFSDNVDIIVGKDDSKKNQQVIE